VELFSVLNELEELIESSTKVPMTKRILVDEDKLLDYLDRIRTALPEEIRQAKWVMQERDKFLAEAKREANRTMEEAKSEAGRTVEDAQKQLQRQADQSEVVRLAEFKAAEIQDQARDVATEIKQGARNYAEDILARLEINLAKVMEQVQAGRDELKSMNKK